MTTNAVALSVEQLSLQQPPLHKIRWHLPAGSKLAIVGPNGAGKTTLLKCIAGLLQPYQGSVLIHKVPIHQLSRRQRAQQLAFVAQHNAPEFGLSVADIVALARIPYASKDPDNEVIKALELMQLQSMLNKSLSQLSGGERQRVMVAKALAQSPKLLLLDEPCNHLDINQQLNLLSIIQSRHCSVVATMHDLNLASHFDYVLMLKEGQQVAFGRAEEVMQPERLLDVYGVQAHARECPFHQTPNFAFALGKSA